MVLNLLLQLLQLLLVPLPVVPLLLKRRLPST